MILLDGLKSYVDSGIAADREAVNAFNEFLKNIPSRLLQCELDISASNKQGIIQGDKVYKYGYVSEKDTVFLEFFENRAQGSPSMAMYADKAKAMLTIRGCKVTQRFLLCFKNVGGKIERVSKLED